MICETWKDAESLDAHEKAAHFITLVPKLQELGKMKLENLNSNPVIHLDPTKQIRVCINKP